MKIIPDHNKRKRNQNCFMPDADIQTSGNPEHGILLKFFSASHIFNVPKIWIHLLLLSFLSLSVLPGCSGEKEADSDETENPADPAPYSGSYRIEPTAGKILYLNKDGRAVVNDHNGSEILSGRYSTGNATLRIFFSEENKPDAVFLLEDFSKDGWRGRWGTDIKILYKN